MTSCAGVSPNSARMRRREVVRGEAGASAASSSTLCGSPYGARGCAAPPRRGRRASSLAGSGGGRRARCRRGRRGARRVAHRQLGRDAPPLAAVGVEVELEEVLERPAGADHGQVLVEVPAAERRREEVRGGPPEQLIVSREPSRRSSVSLARPRSGPRCPWRRRRRRGGCRRGRGRSRRRRGPLRAGQERPGPLRRGPCAENTATLPESYKTGPPSVRR